MRACVFNGCTKPATEATGKCDFHRGRTKCIIDGCANQVYARQLCIRHGGKKLCIAPGCGSNARSGDYCCRHGADNTKQICTHAGCHRVAHLRQKCVRHGGGRPCHVNGCTTHARAAGYCWRHRKRANDAVLPPAEPDDLWMDVLQELARSDADDEMLSDSSSFC
ncbi:hypothetical protein SPRG_10096 [Saprolegnia parasitica CBS 223.65]|uniref:Uncharacterized protein n=1 Tax=Saprolegnia parasitica (strain CBS 223.65) TaxID=695850 RepID=A0A067CDD7_SAPPC|nr:hypothetical protein SPRG_10096 [Saprolegnia parasitica CBS 223.65]KDO24566.1 hypothetical protein SPRG_10096 [Saprolegnia parasitica CBS 223.65]|eukprot:XP_012204635.1 hypothetical protein SPRG_10096 [Saprolegnia parasitica CBS 223.65]